MKDKKPLGLIVAKKVGKLEVFKIATQNLRERDWGLKVDFEKQVISAWQPQRPDRKGRDGIDTLKSQWEKDPLRCSREGDITMDERIEKLRGKIEGAQELGLHNRDWAAVKSSLGLEEYEVMEEAFRCCDTADRRSEMTEQDMEAIEEREKGADDPSDSTPLCSEFECCNMSTANISDTEY